MNNVVRVTLSNEDLFKLEDISRRTRRTRQEIMTRMIRYCWRYMNRQKTKAGKVA